MAATTDRLSGGRLFLGVGTGEALNERPLGFPFPGYAERQARMQEALEIMHRLFQGEKLTFDGEHYTTTTAKLYSPPKSARCRSSWPRAARSPRSSPAHTPTASSPA